MDHKLGQGDINLSDRQNLRIAVKSVAQLAFKTYINLHGKLSPATSSGDSQNRLSLAGRSSTHLSDPATAASHQLTGTTAATSISSVRGGHGSPSHAYALNSTGTSYGMIPRSMARQHQHPSQQGPSSHGFMGAPPLTQVPVPTGTVPVGEMAPPGIPPGGQLQPSGLPTFGGMNPGDPYYYSYMFSPPQGSWGPHHAHPGNPVAFPPGPHAHMTGVPQDFGMGGTHFFAHATGDGQNFGSGAADGG